MSEVLTVKFPRVAIPAELMLVANCGDVLEVIAREVYGEYGVEAATEFVDGTNEIADRYPDGLCEQAVRELAEYLKNQVRFFSVFELAPEQVPAE